MVTESARKTVDRRHTISELLERVGGGVVGGSNITKQATWLIDFAHRDLSAASRQEIAELWEVLPVIGVWDQTELQRLADQPVSSNFAESYRVAGFAKRLPPAEAESFKAKLKGRPLDERDQPSLIDLFQKPVLRLLEDLLTKGESVTEELRTRFRVRKGARVLETVWDWDNSADIFLGRAASVIQTVTDSLARCANSECRCVFIQNRRDKQFCSEACGSLVRVRRARKIEADRKRLLAEKRGREVPHAAGQIRKAPKKTRLRRRGS